MKLKVEGSGLKIGVDNSITDSMQSGEWGMRFIFTNDDHTGRFETILPISAIRPLIGQLEKTLEEMEWLLEKNKNV